ncbi:hypothetical protein HS125_08680 [bacterium]|nr:hypothetical protein [bacterium]
MKSPTEQRKYEKKYGAPLDLPETWDDFVRQTEFFHRLRRALWHRLCRLSRRPQHTVYDYSLQVWTRAGIDAGWRFNAGQRRLDRRPGVYRGMLNHAAAIHPHSRDMDSVKSGFAFARSEAALMINWFRFAAMCQTLPGRR